MIVSTLHRESKVNALPLPLPQETPLPISSSYIEPTYASQLLMPCNKSIHAFSTDAYLVL